MDFCTEVWYIKRKVKSTGKEMNVDLLKYVLKNEVVQIEAALDMAPDKLAKKLEKFIKKLDDHEGMEDTAQALNDAVIIAKEFSDSLLLWLTVMATNGMISMGALEILTEVSYSLLHDESPTPPELTDIDDTSVFYSFSDEVLPELVQSAAATPTLFCFREHCKAPKRLKSMLNLCCVAGELATFPDFDRYSINIEVGQEYAADIALGLRALAKLSYTTTLLHITKGESKLGAALSQWAKAQIPYKKVYKNINATLGIAETEDDAYLH